MADKTIEALLTTDIKTDIKKSINLVSTYLHTYLPITKIKVCD
jgi:hypothetical protein